ncbi:MAG: hypothetical protein HYW47_07385 [Deltaproteobacteria bacterium]|nr:hypothetical protein [Deltaproteobacteria bacterium]
MKVFKIGSQIGQTVRNVGRFRTILSVFAKHGFGEIVERVNLSRFLPFKLRRKKEDLKKLSVAERLRICFEDLGPTFVKLGQLLSTRPDMIPEDLCNELKKLQDQVPPLEFEKIKPFIEKEFGKPIHEVFSKFKDIPFAAASIAQVHEAELLTGEEVVVKIRRPDIEDRVKTDVQLLHIIAGLLDKYIPEVKPFNPMGQVNEFERSLKQELNFLIEANNMIRIKENMKDVEDVLIPHVYKELTTSHILTQEKIKGIRLSNIKKIKSQKNINTKKLTHTGVQAFYKQVMIDGLFHGDLHAGNLFVIEDSKLGMVDFGIVGHLTKQIRTALTNMFLCLISEDYETLVYEFLDIGSQKGKVNIQALQSDIKALLEPYYGMPLKDFNVGRLLLDLTVCASRHNIQMSQDLMLVSKAIITIEGMGKELDPEFDLLSEMTYFSKEIFKDRYNPAKLGKEMIWLLQDFSGVLRTLPRYLKQIIRKQTSDDFTYRVEIEHLENLMKELSQSHKYQGHMMFASFLVLSSTLLIIYKIGPIFLGFSLCGVFGLGFSLFLALILFLRS